MDEESTRSHHRAGPDSASNEWRRLHALHLKESGWKQRDIAIALDVTEGAVSQWMASALHSHMMHGRCSRLMPEQKRLNSEFRYCDWRAALHPEGVIPAEVVYPSIRDNSEPSE